MSELDDKLIENYPDITDREHIMLREAIELWARMGFAQKHPGDPNEVFYSKDLKTHLMPGLCFMLAPLFQSELEKAKIRAGAETQFWLMGELSTEFLGYLFVHTTQAGFPEMSGEIIRKANKWQREKFKEASKILLPERATELESQKERIEK